MPGGLSSEGNNTDIIFINANKDIRLNITLDNNTVEGVAAAMNDAVMVGVLTTPIETPLTEEELAAYNELYTNHPNTTVLTDSAAIMGVEYTADTKLFIQNLIANLGGTEGGSTTELPAAEGVSF